jgi:hypothetical protein
MNDEYQGRVCVPLCVEHSPIHVVCRLIDLYLYPPHLKNGSFFSDL